MRRDLPRQVAKRGGQPIGNRNGSHQRASNFPARMTRTRHEVLNQERGNDQDGQDDPAKPPGKRGRREAQGGFRQELEEEHAGSDQDSAAEKEASTENQGNAVLGALETNQSDGGEDKGKQAANDLEVTLK